MKPQTCALVLTGMMFLTPTALAQSISVAPEQAERLVIKMRGAPEWGHKPTIRQLETEQLRLTETVGHHTRSLRWLRPSAQGAHVLVFEPGTAASEKIRSLAALQRDNAVEWVEVDRRIQANAASPLVGLGNVLNSSARSWFLKARDQEPASSNTQTLWQRFHGDSSSIVAVVDTGILAGHPSLQGHVLPGFDMVADPFIANDGQALGSGSDRDSDASDPGNGVTFANTLTNPECGNPKNSTWHGTFVSALIAGNPMQAEQVFPINWHGQILPVRALGRCGGFTSDLADAIRWAAGLPVPNTPINTTPARVINLSLGATGGCSSNIEGAAVSAALAQGAVVIAAAGNAGGALDSPSNCPGAIAVGALDQEGLKADYSNHGSRITLMAPGGDAAFPMWSAGNSGTQAPGNNTYTSKTGTSFAAPLVAATASLMISLNPALTPADIIRILTQTSRPFISRAASPACSVSLNSTACNCNTSDCGSGMLDTAAAVNAARPDQVLANLLGPSRVAPGEMAVFDASTSFNPTGGALTYEWLVRGFTGAQAPIINRPTAANTEVSFPGSSGAYQLSLTVSNGSQSHSILKNVVISESSAATADVLGALQNVVVASLISPSASSNDTTAGPAAGSSDAGGSGSAVTPSAGGGGGGQLPAGALLCLLTGLIGLRMSRAGDRNS